MIPATLFPRLTPTNHRITSEATADYNCIAWAACDDSHWWEPGRHWPVAVRPGESGLEVLVDAFASLGFESCDDGSLEDGFEKVVLYGTGQFYTHAARQLPSGGWTSKLGKSEDIEHDTPDSVAGPLYGEPVQFMRRIKATQ